MDFRTAFHLADNWGVRDKFRAQAFDFPGRERTHVGLPVDLRRGVF